MVAFANSIRIVILSALFLARRILRLARPVDCFVVFHGLISLATRNNLGAAPPLSAGQGGNNPCNMLPLSISKRDVSHPIAPGGSDKGGATPTKEMNERVGQPPILPA